MGNTSHPLQLDWIIISWWQEQIIAKICTFLAATPAGSDDEIKKCGPCNLIYDNSEDHLDAWVQKLYLSC